MTKATCHPDREVHGHGLCEPCYKAAYWLAHKEEGRAKNAAYNAAHREEWKIYYAAHRDERIAYNISRNAAIRLEVFNAYGGPRCVCCGETLLQGLSIDHINGDGAKFRKQYGQGRLRIYNWLKKQGYPAGYQVLCMTCNVAKGTGDHCPHQDGKAQVVQEAVSL